MRRLVIACLAALAVVVPASSSATPTRTTHQAAANQAAGVFRVVYATPKTSDEAFLEKLIKASQLSQVADALSKAFILPHDVTIAVTRGQNGPYFDPSTKTIVFNLPFAELMFKVITNEYPNIKPYDFGVGFASLEYFVLFHEIGHSLINLWHIPVLGREEDAVDAFSTIFMTKYVKDGEIALWGADFFNQLATGEKYGKVAFADEHSLSAQRAYSIACWVYGSAPSQYGFLRKIIPKERLVRCPGEYHGLLTAWISFLKPHVR